jgi:hypothetical protein
LGRARFHGKAWVQCRVVAGSEGVCAAWHCGAAGAVHAPRLWSLAG